MTSRFIAYMMYCDNGRCQMNILTNYTTQLLQKGTKIFSKEDQPRWNYVII